MDEEEKFNKYDRVRLVEEYQIKTVYTVVGSTELENEIIVSLCPEEGGLIVSANQDNLELV